MCSYINQKQVVHELLYYTYVAIQVHWLTIVATALTSACDLISTSTTDE